MVRSGALTARQVDDILDLQRSQRNAGGRHTVFGGIAMNRGYITDADLGRWVEAKALFENFANGRAT